MASRRELIFLMNYVLTNIKETSQFDDFQDAFERIEEIIYVKNATQVELQDNYRKFWNNVYNSKGALFDNKAQLETLLSKC